MNLVARQPGYCIYWTACEVNKLLDPSADLNIADHAFKNCSFDFYVPHWYVHY
jgi:hypothetical protein